jgi:hypothetical protein
MRKCKCRRQGSSQQRAALSGDPRQSEHCASESVLSSSPVIRLDFGLPYNSAVPSTFRRVGNSTSPTGIACLIVSITILTTHKFLTFRLRETYAFRGFLRADRVFR